jgi:hypothetical protein
VATSADSSNQHGDDGSAVRTGSSGSKPWAHRLPVVKEYSRVSGPHTRKHKHKHKHKHEHEHRDGKTLASRAQETLAPVPFGGLAQPIVVSPKTSSSVEKSTRVADEFGHGYR